MLLEILMTLAFGLAALLIFIYYVRKGQFDSSEDVKYQMFHDEEQEALRPVAKQAEQPLSDPLVKMKGNVPYNAGDPY